MALNLEKSIPFTREKKLKLNLYLSLSAYSRQSLNQYYTPLARARVTARIPLLLLESVNSINSIQYFGNRGVEKNILSHSPGSDRNLS